MPKLNPEKAASTEQAEGGDFAPLEPGVYPARLRSVEAKDGAKGVYWSWEFEIPEEFEHSGRRFWNNTSLTEASEWKLKETFAAFGVPADTDTDELCGALVLLSVGVRTIQSGAKAGQPTNSVEEVMPWSDEPAGAAPGEEEQF